MESNEVADLVTRARDGDERAFDRLVDEYSRYVYITALSILNNRELAHDVTQEVFIKAYRSLSELREPHKFPGWLKAIGRNRALSQYRKESRRKEVSGLPDAQLLPDSDRYDPFAEEDVDKRRAELLKRLELLPEIQRKLLLLKYVQKLSIKKIAQHEELTEAAVRNHLYRARKLLRGMLKNEG